MRAYNDCPAGISRAAPEASSSHKDAHIRYPRCSTRSYCVLDRQRHQQAWPLCQLSRAQDGGVWSVHQRAVGTFLDPHATEGVFRKDESDREDPADCRQQSNRKHNFRQSDILRVEADRVF